MAFPGLPVSVNTVLSAFHFCFATCMSLSRFIVKPLSLFLSAYSLLNLCSDDFIHSGVQSTNAFIFTQISLGELSMFSESLTSLILGKDETGSTPSMPVAVFSSIVIKGFFAYQERTISVSSTSKLLESYTQHDSVSIVSIEQVVTGQMSTHIY